MIIIWGTKAMKKLLAYTQAYTCPRCGRAAPFMVLRVAKWFTLFWIPIFPYSFKYYMVCPSCEIANEMDKDQAKALAAAAKEQKAQQP